MSAITRFSVRSSGRDLTQVRRPAKPKVQKAKAPKPAPPTEDADVEPTVPDE